MWNCGIGSVHDINRRASIREPGLEKQGRFLPVHTFFGQSPQIAHFASPTGSRHTQEAAIPRMLPYPECCHAQDPGIPRILPYPGCRHTPNAAMPRMLPCPGYCHTPDADMPGCCHAQNTAMPRMPTCPNAAIPRILPCPGCWHAQMSACPDSRSCPGGCTSYHGEESATPAAGPISPKVAARLVRDPCPN